MGKNARTQGQGSSRGHSSNAGYIGDRKLIPRIKEYIKENNGHMLEADEVATALQAEYSEYSRKKKAAFRNSVARALKQVSSEEEGRLQQLERRHFDSRQRRAKGDDKRGADGREEMEDRGERSGSDDDSLADIDFEEEETRDDHNMMNNSLLLVYADECAVPILDLTSGTASMSDSHACSDEDASLNEIQTAIVPSPVNVPEGVCSGELLSHVTTTDGHVIAGDSHVTTGDTHVKSSTSMTDVTACSGGSVRMGRGEEVERGRVDIEERRTLKKVTFAPDVVDKQPKTALKSPIVPRKRRHVVLGEDDGVPSPHKKHRSHREHRAHSSRLGKRGRGGRVEGGGGSSEMENAIAKTLEEKHKKSQFKVEKSSVTFADVGGCQSAIKEVHKLMLHLRHPEVFARLGVCPPQGFLLHGPPGCGKTLLASAIAGEMGLPLIQLAATEVVSGVSGESESTLRDLFTLAKGSMPCVLFIDEVDAICPKRATAQREMEKRIVSQLLACVDDLHSSAEGNGVLLIAATTQPDSLDPAIRRSGRFDREICLGIPDEASRLSILQVLTRGLSLEPDFPFRDLAHNTPGYVGADLRALIREASLCAVNRLLSTRASENPVHSHPHFPTVEGVTGTSEVNQSREGTEMRGAPPGPTENFATPPGDERKNNTGGCPLDPLHVSEADSAMVGREDSCMFITVQDFQLALQEVQPSAKREGFATVPDTSWDDVGALHDVREELSLAILAPVRYPQQFASLGLTTPPGILLAGPPGCGKTLLAKAVANESGINFISVKGPELLNMYVGESERAVRQVFQRARNSAPCVIFFDELDALCPRRSEMAESSASARVVNQLLTEMDGVQARRHVFIMAATNRPDIIDPAVLRPGRLDKLVYVGLPNTEDRATILNTITKNGTQPVLDPNVDIAILASPSHTEGFSGADLKALVREAAIAALKEYVQLQSSHWVTPDQSDRATSLSSSAIVAAERSKVDVSECSVSMHHFISALERVSPSVSEKDRLFYNRIREQFCRTTHKN